MDCGEVEEDSQAGTLFKEGNQLFSDLGDGVMFDNAAISELNEEDAVLERNNQMRELLGHAEPFGRPRKVQRNALGG